MYPQKKLSYATTKTVRVAVRSELSYLY